MTVIEQFPLGTPIHGELNTVDADPAVEVILFNPAASAVSGYTTPISVAADERLVLTHVQTFVQLVTAGLAQVFFDNDNLSSARAIASFGDNGGAEDTMVLAGDLADEFRAGRIFTIANDTDNNGAETSTGATYDADADTTTVTVVTASWSGVTADGDVTSAIFIDSGTVIFQNDSATLRIPDSISWPIGAMRRGPLGHTVYLQVESAFDRTLVIVDGFLQKTLTKTGPIPPQARA